MYPKGFLPALILTEVLFYRNRTHLITFMLSSLIGVSRARRRCDICCDVMELFVTASADRV